MAEAGDRSFLDPGMLARLGRLSLTTSHPMEGNMSGMHRSPHRGSSVEFAEYRQYAPGDDLRRLDWRVYGRSDRFFIKEFEAETNLRCHLVLDLSGSMGFNGGQGSRLDYGRKIAGSLAYLLSQQGDAVGLTLPGRVDIPARRTASHLQLIQDALAGAKASGETQLVGEMHRLAETVRRRALVVLITDGFVDRLALREALQHLRFQKHDVVLFQLIDAQELDFQFDRPVRFQDMESADSLVSEPAAIRNDYLQALNTFLDQVRQDCHELGVDLQRTRTDANLESLLADFLTDRAGRLAGQHPA